MTVLLESGNFAVFITGKDICLSLTYFPYLSRMKSLRVKEVSSFPSEVYNISFKVIEISLYQKGQLCGNNELIKLSLTVKNVI